MRALGLSIVLLSSFVVGLARADEPIELERPGVGVDDHLGFSGQVGDGIAVVGIPSADFQGVRSGFATVFRQVGTVWLPWIDLAPSDPNPGQRFGADIELADDWLFIGAPGDDDGGNEAGAVYVFRRALASWVPYGKIVPSDLVPEDRFGAELSFSEFGGRPTLAIGADGSDTAAFNAGAVYVYELQGTTWAPLQKLVAFDADVEDRFGCAAALFRDRLLVGAWLHSESTAASGSVYAYEFDGTTWSFVQRLPRMDPQSGEGFGTSLAMDAEHVVVGAPYRSVGEPRAGAAIVYSWSGTDYTWMAELTAPVFFADDRLGSAVAIDDGVIAAGTWLSDLAEVDAGSVELFALRAGSWESLATWTASDPQPGGHFGAAVDLAGEAGFVGSPDADGSAEDSGRAFLIDVPRRVPFIRSDCNADGQVDLSDAIHMLESLFVTGSVTCEAACNANTDGAFDLSDAIFLLTHIFQLGPNPTAPFPDCGIDLGELDECTEFPGC